ncbi:NF-X1-type zinc finger protein NFXL1 [Tanacetum coccineum]
MGRAPTSIDLSAEKNQGFNWRCPGCQSVQLTSFKDIHYVCFCGKRQDPPSDPYLTPHSCGEPCGKALDKDLAAKSTSATLVLVHPVRLFAPPKMCPCGKKTITIRCSDQSQKSLLTCGERYVKDGLFSCNSECGKTLGCGNHVYKETCHLGHVNVVKDGLFSCNSECEKTFGCGNHVYKETCHPGVCGFCELLPGAKIKILKTLLFVCYVAVRSWASLSWCSCTKHRQWWYISLEPIINNPCKVKENPIIASATASSANRWSVLESEVAHTNVTTQAVATNVVSSKNEPASSSSLLKQEDVVEN